MVPIRQIKPDSILPKSLLDLVKGYNVFELDFEDDEDGYQFYYEWLTDEDNTKAKVFKRRVCPRCRKEKCIIDIYFVIEWKNKKVKTDRAWLYLEHNKTINEIYLLIKKIK